jgi:hypothetical protein
VYGISFIIFLSIGTAACQAADFASSTPTLFQTQIPTPFSTPSPTAPIIPTPYWKQIDADGVLLGIQVPAGWAAHRAQAGLLLAERGAGIGENTPPAVMELHIFVWRMNRFADLTPTLGNPAHVALNQVVSDRELIGTAQATAPISFEWDGHPAAYYLLRDGQETLGVVIGFALPPSERLVILNLSAPHSEAEVLRPRLADLLATFTVNGDRLHTGALDSLPDPLDFPVIEQTANMGRP